MDALESNSDQLERILSPGEQRLRRPTDAICHWFVRENAVDIKGSAPSGSIDEVTFRWIMNEDAMTTEKLAESISIFARTCRNYATELTGSSNSHPQAGP